MSDSLDYKSGNFIVRPVPIASGVVVEIGDQLKISSGKAVCMTAVTDNLTFIGKAASAHRSTDGSGTVNVYIPLPNTIFETQLDTSTSVVFGDQLQWYAKQKLKVSTTDAIAVAMESKLSATEVLVAYKLPYHTNGLKLVGDAS